MRCDDVLLYVSYSSGKYDYSSSSAACRGARISQHARISWSATSAMGQDYIEHCQWSQVYELFTDYYTLS